LCHRIKGIVECAPKNVLEAIWNPKYTKDLSQSVDTHSVLGNLSNGSVVVHHKHISPATLVSARDFVVLRSHEAKEATCEYTMASVSVETSLMPEISGYVRGHLIISGWTIKPAAENPNHSIVSYVIQTDPKGWLPGFVIANAQKSCPDSIKILRDFCKKTFK